MHAILFSAVFALSVNAIGEPFPKHFGFQLPAKSAQHASAESTVKTEEREEAQKPTSPWSKSFTPPDAPESKHFVLEPLGPHHAEKDHAAFMGSRDHIRHTLQWGGWPADDTTVEQNRKDLARHLKEFENREAYAYSVLSPNRKKCIGCVYIKPVQNKTDACAVAYWVVESELKNDFDKKLQNAMLNWLAEKWAMKMVVLPYHENNDRGIKFAKEAGARQAGPERDGRVRYVWRAK